MKIETKKKNIFNHRTFPAVAGAHAFIHLVHGEAASLLGKIAAEKPNLDELQARVSVSNIHHRYKLIFMAELESSYRLLRIPEGEFKSTYNFYRSKVGALVIITAAWNAQIF